MRTILFTFLSLLLSFMTNAQTDFYYYRGDSIFLYPDSAKCTLEFLGVPNESLLDQHNLIYTKLVENFYVVDGEASFVASLEQGVYDVLPQYHTSDGQNIKMKCEVVLAFNDSIPLSIRNAVLSSHNLILSEDFTFFQVYRTTNPLGVSKTLNESGLVKYCDPNFILEVIKASHTPDDEFFIQQWNLQNTGQYDSNGLLCQPGADINLFDGWSLTTGDPEVLIAVINDPSQYYHPDIPEKKICRLQGANLAPDADIIPESNYSHGTCVSGIICAEMDNNIGVTGVSPSCRIVPVMEGTYISVDQGCGSSYYAIKNGARVLSFSGDWGGYCNAGDYSVEAAIQFGLIVCRAARNTASHNDGIDGEVTNPGMASIPHLIIVGASDRGDTQADYSPTDPLIDIVAPSASDFQTYHTNSNNPYTEIPAPIIGEERNIWTTDLTSSTGVPDPSNPWAINYAQSQISLGEELPSSSVYGNPHDYTGRFYGTSAATPQVASVAALILSANSCLTVEQVEEILFQTATKIGGPAEYDTEGHSNKFGHGKVNATAAIEMALSPQYSGIDYEVEVLDYVCGEGDNGSIQINLVNPEGYSAELIYGYVEPGSNGVYDVNSEIVLTTQSVAFNTPITITTVPEHLLVRITSLTTTNSYPNYDNNGVLINPWGGEACRSTREIWVKGLQMNSAIGVTDCNAINSGTLEVSIDHFNLGSNLYDWNINGTAYNDISTVSLENLASGIYEITANDGENYVCPSTVNLTYQFEVESIVDLISCANSSNGRIELIVSANGNSSEFNWDGNLPDNSIIDNLSPGNYNCTVIVGNLCSQDFEFTLSEPSAITTEVSGDFSVLCSTYCDASAEVTASGGTGNLTIGWPVGTDPDALCLGEYDVVVNDENNCEVIEHIIISGPLAITTQVSGNLSVPCLSVCDATAEVTASGGTGNLTITWPVGTDPNALCLGEYEVVIMDENNCEAIEHIVISESDISPITTEVSGNFSTSCSPYCDASVVVTASGGTGNLTITWPDGTDQNALCPGEYEVVITDENNCQSTTTVEITTEQNFPETIIYAGQNWNNQTITFGADLIIPVGEAIFSNVNFVFQNNGQLIINEGALVVMNNCNLTTCEQNWKGIWVQSVGNGVGAGPGNLIMTEGSIKYALTGIMYPDMYAWDGPYESGNVTCTGVTFENNRTALDISKSEQYDDDMNFVGPFSYYDCNFIVNDEYNNHFSQPFQQHVLMHLVKGNGFKSCSFANNMSNGIWAERGRAINAVDARFDVDDIDSDGDDAGLSTFEGFDIAIYNHAFLFPYNGMIVRESQFNNNRIGILTRGVCFHDIVRNTIDVGNSTGIAGLDAEEIDREGIVIDGGGFFLLSENEVTGYPLSGSAATVGIRIRDIVTGNEEIYNNTIINCNYANLANGQNSVNEEGVRYVCNHHLGSITDLLVSEFPDNGTAASISPWQSDLGSQFFGDPLEKSAGNTFSPNPIEWNISNEGLQNINYLFGTGSLEEPSLLNGSISLSITSVDNTCQNIVVDMIPNTGLLDSISIMNWQAALTSSKQDWLESKYIYKAIIDDGSTQELMEEVENIWDQNVWGTRSRLLDVSPYVSEDVLYDLADKTLDGFPHAIALEIFAANPNVAADNRFIYYLQNDCDFPEYMIDILLQINNLSALREEVESALACNHMRYLEAASPLIKFNLRQSSGTRSNLVQDLGDLESLTAEFLIMDILLSEKNAQGAQQRFDDLDDHIRLTREMKNERQAFGLWLSVATNYPEWDKLSLPDKAVIDQLATSYYQTHAGKKAMAVLNAFYGEDHFIPPYYNGANGQVRALTQRNNTINPINLMLVYPNPANEMLQINLNLKGFVLTNESIRITDGEGKLIATIQVKDAHEQIIFDSRSFAPGSYYISLCKASDLLQTEKINVVH
jgi:hypothetical protein